MAEFDKAPEPTQDPNWMFFSRPAREQPRANESKNILLEGSGKDLEEGAKLADSLQADNVKNKVFDIEQGERDKFISAASTLKQQQDASQYADNSNSPGILSQNPLASAPPAVQQGVQQARSIQNAYDNGKMSTMQYHANVIPKLQALRHDYPGYRDVIDPAIGNNANEYMRGLVTELNERQSEAKAERNKLITMGMDWGKEGYFGAQAPLVMQMILHGQLDQATLMKLAMPTIQHNLWMKSQEDSHKMQEWNDQDLGKKAGAMVDHIATDTRYTSVVWPATAAKVASGMTIGVSGSPQSDIDAIAYGKQHLATVDENEQAQHAANLQVYARQVESSIDQQYNKPMPGDRLGRTIGEVAGSAKVKEAKDRALSDVSAWVEMAGDPKTFATSVAAENIIKHQINMDAVGMLRSPEMGPPMRMMAAITKNMGPEGVGLWTDTILDSGVLGPAKQALSQYHLANMFAQPDPNKPATFGGAAKDGAESKIQEPQFYAGLLKSINLVTSKDVDPETKRKGLTAFFAPTPENRSAIQYFNKDTRDENGRWVNGADTMFQTMTGDAVTKEVLRQKDPQISKNYRDTVDAWFTNLTRRNLADLSQAVHPYAEFKSRGVTVNKVPEFKFTYNDSNNELDVPPEVRQHLQMTRQRTVLDSLTKFNMSLRNMGHIIDTVQAAGYPADKKAYMLQLLNTLGLEAKPEDKAEVEQIKAAILATSKKQANNGSSQAKEFSSLEEAEEAVRSGSIPDNTIATVKGHQFQVYKNPAYKPTEVSQQ